jgi:hypothetical protein
MDLLRGICPAGGILLIILLAFVPSIRVFAEDPSDAPSEIPSDAPVEIPLPPLPEAEKHSRAITGEASAELMSLSLGDTDVSLFTSGYWKGSLSLNWGPVLTPLGLSVSSGDSPLLFTQETDLTLSLLIRKRWFVEAGFRDEYTMNTYRAGYRGAPGEMVQYVGVGNAGLDYPVFPYLDLGGDSPSSFGVYGRFGSGPLQIHGLVRYDAAAREERVFVGSRERTYSHVSPDNPLRGLSFILPAENISQMPLVYLEDEAGTIGGSDRRRWRRAGPGEYAVSARYGLLELSKVPAGRVAVAYASSYPLGSYGLETAPGSGTFSGAAGFLGEVQDFLRGLPLADFPQSGQDDPALPGRADNIPGTVRLEDPEGPVAALVVYERGTFSPFERQNRYRAPTSNSSDAALVTLSTGETLRAYELNPLDPLTAAPTVDLIIPPETSRDVYELRSTEGGGEDTRRSPRNRWPLGDLFPEIYLPGKQIFTGDMGIRFTNYGAGGAYAIGTGLVPGSVQVYRGGLADPRFSYNAATGVLSLDIPAGFNELIRITYLKQDDNRKNGSLASGIGVLYDPEGPFSGGLSLGLRWNINAGAYSEEGETSPGTVGLSGRADWDHEHLKTGLTLGLAFEQSDTSGLYRIAGMEGTELTLGFPAEASFISRAPADSAGLSPPFSGLGEDKRAPLVYRNYRKTDLFGSVTMMPIDWAEATEVPGKNGPYPAADTVLSRETLLVAEFALGEGKTWTGFQVPLGIHGDILERAREIRIPFRFYGFEPDPGFRVLVQFGALADETGAEAENPSLIVSKELYSPENPVAGSARIALLRLDDRERARLRDAGYMRFIILREREEPVSGRVLFSPPVVSGAGFRAILARDGEVRSAPDRGFKSVSVLEKTDVSLEEKYGDRIDKLHRENTRQQVLEVSWAHLDQGESPGADIRTGAIPLSAYRSLSFFFKPPPVSAGGGSGAEGTAVMAASRLRFLIAGGPPAGDSPGGKTLLEALIPLSAFSPGQWSLVNIHYGVSDRGVSVDGHSAGEAHVDYRPGGAAGTGGLTGTGGSDDGGAKSGYMAVFLEGMAPAAEGISLPAGAFSIDEICLEEAAPAYRVNAGAQTEWTRPGALLSLGDKAILEDVSLGTALETGARGDPFSPGSGLYAGMASRSRGEFTLLGTRLRGNLSLSLLTGGNSWSAGHDISRTWGPFSIREAFSDAPADDTMTHEFDLRLETLLSSRFGGELFYENNKLQRRWTTSLGLAGRGKIPLGFSIAADAKWTENTGEAADWLDNYGKTWLSSWRPLIPDTGGGAQKRNIRGIVRVPLKTSPVGVEVSAEGLSEFTEPAQTTLSETLGRLDIPFGFGSWQGLLRGERIFRRSLFYRGADALDDGFRYYESIADSLPLWYAPPLYSLFAPGLADTMAEVTEGAAAFPITEYGRFRDALTMSLRLPARYGWEALLIPMGIETKLARDLERKLDTRLDAFSVASILRFSAVNTFGAFGATPLFSFYQTDELSHNLEGAVTIPRNDALSWRVQDEHSFSFYGFSGAELTISNTLSLGSSAWSESLVAAWTVPARKSLLGSFYDWLGGLVRDRSGWPALSNLAAAEYERLRRETLEVVVSSARDTAQRDRISSRIAAGHESIIRIQGRLYLSAFIKLDCSQDYAGKTFSFIGTVGTTLNIMF